MFEFRANDVGHFSGEAINQHLNTSTFISPLLNVTNQQTGAPDCQLASLEHPDQLYVNLSTFWYCFLALITTIGLVVSLVSNMIIIYLFTRTPSLRSNPSNIIAANLSFSDLLYCIQWPSVIYCSLTQSTWILEAEYVCQVFGFITVSTAMASILTVLAMSVERAIVIKYSIYVKDRFTIKLAWLIIIVIWSVSLLFCLPPLFGKFNRYTLDPSKTSCTLDYLSRQTNYRLYIAALTFLYWFAPAILICISYIIIIITFKRSSLSLKKVAASELQSSANRTQLSSSYSTASSPGFQNAGGPAMFVGRRKRVLRDSIRIRNFITSLNNKPTSGNQEGVKKGAEPATRRASASALDLKQAASKGQSAGNLIVSESNEIALEWGDFKRVASSSTSILPFKTSSHSNLESFEPTGPPSNSLGGQPEQSSAGNINAAAPTFRQRNNPFGNPLLRLKRFSRGSIRSCQLSNGPKAGRTSASMRTATELRCSGLGAILSSTTRNMNPLNHHRGPGTGQTAAAGGQPSIVAQAANSQLTRAVLQFRLAKMSLYVILLWFISWTPIASLAFLNSIKSCHRASATAVFMASTMTKLGPAFDVFIYGISHPKIKTKFKQTIKWLLMMGDNPGAGLVGANQEHSAQLHNNNTLGNASMKSCRANSIETQMSLNL